MTALKEIKRQFPLYHKNNGFEELTGTITGPVDLYTQALDALKLHIVHCLFNPTFTQVHIDTLGWAEAVLTGYYVQHYYILNIRYLEINTFSNTLGKKDKWRTKFVINYHIPMLDASEVHNENIPIRNPCTTS